MELSSVKSLKIENEKKSEEKIICNKKENKKEISVHFVLKWVSLTILLSIISTFLISNFLVSPIDLSSTDPIEMSHNDEKYAILSSESIISVSQSLGVGLRVHRKNGQGDAAEMAAKVAKRVSEAKGYSSRVAVAVDVADDELVEAVKAAAGDVVDKLIPVEWGRFVPALNALVSDAASAGVDKIMFQSTEIEVKASSVVKLVEALEDDKTLVAGAALPGHKVGKGRMGLNGLTMPWNTLAVWDVTMLSSTGFLMVSEGIADASTAGVEEAAVIATQQLMHPGAAEAKLIRVPGVAWETNFNDDSRAQWHAKKMASKERRVSNQLSLIRVPAAVVEHQ